METRHNMLLLMLVLFGAVLAACDDEAKQGSDTGEEVLSDTGTDDVMVDMVEDTGPQPPNCGLERCDDAQICCGSACIDVNSDPSHCGGCGMACDAAAECASGDCVCGGQSCAGDEACCSIEDAPVCVAIEDNPAHCGACGNACGDNEICQGGLCLCQNSGGIFEQCRDNEACCPGLGCRALGSDASSCGTCGLVCNPGELCSGGVCACGDVRGASSPACGDGEACCGTNPTCVADDSPQCQCDTGTCAAGELCCQVDTDEGLADRCTNVNVDGEHCGACGNFCGANQLCVGGGCVCEGGFADCNNDPSDGCEVHLATDASHCGGCGLACESGELCDGVGRCRTTCQAGATQCGNSCVWLDRTPDECGACGFSCGVGEVCSGGFCATSCQLGLTNCSGACVDLSRDRFNCSACGIACAAGEVCTDGRCSLSCEEGLANCGGSCVDLSSDEGNCAGCGIACSRGQKCDAGVCVLECQDELTKCGSLCVDTMTDRLNCGGCGAVCAVGQVCDGSGACSLSCQQGLSECFGVCVDTSRDDDNCGACGSTCGNGYACTDGVCQLECPGDLITCGGTCVDPRTSENNCGGCSRSCASGQRCIDGACILSCPVGQIACDGTCINPRTDLEHCGASGSCSAGDGTAGVACPSGTVCTAGACASSCGSGQELCDGACASTQFDPSNCGGCGVTCDDTNAVAACVNGVCRPICDPLYADCDGDPQNGCEVELTTDADNCGRCDVVCPSGTDTPGACNAGFCELVCPTDTGDCDRLSVNGCETDTTSAVQHCGGCGLACPQPVNSLAACVDSACSTDCFDGFGDCDSDASNGCEASFENDPDNCGGCDNPCTAPTNANPTCGLGLCGWECQTDFGNCDGDDSNGCEQELLTDPNFCGACTPCAPVPGADTTCSGGICGFTCKTNFFDCDGDPSNGCEANLLADAATCGDCATSCTGATPDCVDGTCGLIPFNTATFTNAGATGRFGPTQVQLDAAYVGTEIEGEVTIVSDAPGIQRWVVPATGNYRIEAVGANGGHSGSETGGRGAQMIGTFALARGDVIHILVGQMGGIGSGGGGGGGTFVVREDDTPLIIAGGGGARSSVAINYASITENGKRGDGNSPGNGGTGGNGGEGGTSSGNSGGGGFFTSGTRGTYASTPGAGYLQGGVGGLDHAGADIVSGGFGGGGGSGAGGHGGGAGGYSGGGGSGNSGTGSSGGGGSYNAGTDPVNSEGVGNSHGYVVITLL